MTRPSDRLKELNIVLPPAARPVGAYLPALRWNDMLLLSGQIPLQEGRVAFTGPVGEPEGRSLEYAQQAVRLCTLNALAVAAEAVGGIDHLARVLKLVVYVASCPGFSDQHKVANAASELLVKIFGEAGKHARAAVGVAQLPLNATVEIDLTFGLT
jgi:enamine deaminase RidA (YjgF/YER057c/UK114 family)